MGAKAVIASMPRAAQVRTARLPVGLGLAIGACASLGLWAAVIAGVRTLIS